MANLTDKPISTTYASIFKTNDNVALSASEQVLTDGLGNQSTLSVGTSSASFTGDLDLSAATVTGLPASGVTSIIAGTNITIDQSTGDVTIDAAGGGGGGTIDGTNITKGFLMPGFRKFYRASYSTSNNQYGSFGVAVNTFYVGAITFAEGQTINEVQVNVRTASAGATNEMRLGLYKATTDINGNLMVGALEKDFGFVSTASTGQKTITGINHTLGATESGIYFYAFIASDGGAIQGVQTGIVVSNMLFIDLFSQFNPTRMGAFQTTETYGALPLDLTTGYTWSHTFAYPFVLFA